MYREKILGGLLGKAVGGTLGQIYEGVRGPLNLTYYDPVPTEMIPNDDLDLQVMWMDKIAREWNGVLKSEKFGKAWVDSMHFCCDEYAIATRNLQIGIMPPASGRYDNSFKNGLGAAIRSELWAFLAPNNPDLAAKYAVYDAQVDHTGDGVYAEVFWAALESMAFEESDIRVLINKALNYIPDGSELKQAIKDTIVWSDEIGDMMKVRRQILLKYGSANFTDIIMNVPFMIAALLLGKGNFSDTICMAVNCGRDADCTTATVGAVLGIINPDGIEEKWLKPIGRALVINKEITGVQHPDTLDGFVDLIMEWQGKITCVDIKEPELDWSKYQIHAKCGISLENSCGDFARRKFSVDGELKDVLLPGNRIDVDFSDLPPDCFKIYEMTMHVPCDGQYAVISASTGKCCTWLNGELLFAQVCGNFVPGSHRFHTNQGKIMNLTKGDYTLRIALAPVDEEQMSTPLHFMLVDDHFMYVNDAFDRDCFKK